MKVHRNKLIYSIYRFHKFPTQTSYSASNPPNPDLENYAEPDMSV